MNNNYNKYFTETDAGLNIEANNINANCITSQTNKFSLDSEGNLTVNSISFNTSENNLLSFEAIFNKIYPVGAIYISTSNINPGTLFVGTWEPIKGRTLVSVDTNDNDFNTSKKTGGEKSHQLTVEELPSHNHTMIGYFGANQWAEGYMWLRAADHTTGNIRNDAGTSYTGGNQYHNNMPPYFTVYMWERIS